MANNRNATNLASGTGLPPQKPNIYFSIKDLTEELNQSGMLIGALTSLLPINLRTGNAVTRTSPNPFSTNQTPAPVDSPSLSPAATFLSMLQKLQQQNPTLFKQFTSQLATQYSRQAKIAASQGNSNEANQLKHIASEFQNSSTTGQLPSTQELQQSGFGTVHGVHHTSPH